MNAKFKAALCAALVLFLSACSGIHADFCVGPAGKCNSDDATVTLSAADRQALIDALTSVVKTEVAAAEGRLGDRIDGNEELASKQLGALNSKLDELAGVLNAHDLLTAMSARKINEVADQLDDLALLASNPPSWAEQAEQIRAYTTSSIPMGYRALCLSAANGWSPSEGANVLCWGGRVQWWTQGPVNTEPVKVSDRKLLQVVPGVIGRRTTIKREGSNDDFYCRQPGKPDPHVGDIGWWLPNGDIWLNSQIFRKYGPNGPAPTFTPGSPATNVPGATNTPNNGTNPTATPQSGGNPTATPAVGVTPNANGGITIIINGQPIEITNEIKIELVNAGITPEVLALLLQNMQWQQQIINLLLNQNWPPHDIIVMVIVLVTGQEPQPGQYCIQVQTWACDLGRWFPNPCDARDAGARILVFNQADCPNDVPTVPPGATATDRPINPTATLRPGQATSTRTPGSGQPTTPPNPTHWYDTPVPTTAPSATLRPGQPTPAATSATATTEPTRTPVPTKEVATETPEVTPVSTTRPTRYGCDRQDWEVARDLGIEVEKLKNSNAPGDGCKWDLQFFDPVNMTNMAEGYAFTVKFPYESHPIGGLYGNGEVLNILGGTVRYLKWYRDNAEGNWALVPCQYMDHEETYGQGRVPSWHTLDIGIGCLSWPYKLTKIAGCPTDPRTAAMMLGGQETDWHDIGFTSWREYRAWKFQTTGGRLENLRYPGYGDWDFWDQTRFPAPWKGPIPQAEEATFNCR